MRSQGQNPAEPEGEFTRKLRARGFEETFVRVACEGGQ